MKLIFIFVCLGFLNYFACAQGVFFDTTMSWSQIKATAKKTNKYIFVDFYATWCGPCKMMDGMVFPDENLGREIRNKFIAFKVQVDSSADDSYYIKNRYREASMLTSLYNITGLPTQLYFDPNGEVIYRSSGYQNSKSLITMCQFAVSDDARTIVPRLKAYNQGERNYLEMVSLIKFVKDVQLDRERALVMFSAYNREFLNNQDSNFNFLSRENIELAYRLEDSLHSTDKLFAAIKIKDPHIVDSLAGNWINVGDAIVENMIKREEIYEKLWKSMKPITMRPDWNSIYMTIVNKYSKKWAEALVPTEQISFAFKTGNWKEYVRLQDLKISRIHFDTANYIEDSWELNMAAWRTYLKCNDSIILLSALKWSNLSLEVGGVKSPNPTEQYFDTKARLLYKLGRVQEAIDNEKMAIRQGNINAILRGSQKGPYSDIYQQILQKMENRESLEGLK